MVVSGGRVEAVSLDRFIAKMPAEPDGDLMLCQANGIAYQADRTHVVTYDGEYYGKCASYEASEIAQRINAARCALVARHYSGEMVDVGIGSGQFIRTRQDTMGHDINPVAIEWLKRSDLWEGRLECAGAMSFWDVLEHVPDPGTYLDKVQLHAYVFASLPTFDDLRRVRESKHYRPGEHLQYFTVAGFIEWMRAHGFGLLEYNRDETQAGREAIGSFAFKRFACPTK